MLIAAFAIVLIKRQQLFLNTVFTSLFLLPGDSLPLQVVVDQLGVSLLFLILVIILHLFVNIDLPWEIAAPLVVHHHRLSLPVHVWFADVMQVLSQISIIIDIFHFDPDMVKFQVFFEVFGPNFMKKLVSIFNYLGQN